MECLRHNDYLLMAIYTFAVFSAALWVVFDTGRRMGRAVGRAEGQARAKIGSDASR